MCTTTEQTTATEEPNNPRDINVLLSLSTYQGMTDEEIDLVLNYKIDQAVSSRETLAKITAETTRIEQVIADNRASAQRAHDVLESILEQEFNILPIGQPREFTPHSIGE